MADFVFPSYTENIHVDSGVRLSAQDLSQLSVDLKRMPQDFAESFRRSNHDVYLAKYISERGQK